MAGPRREVSFSGRSTDTPSHRHRSSASAAHARASSGRARIGQIQCGGQVTPFRRAKIGSKDTSQRPEAFPKPTGSGGWTDVNRTSVGTRDTQELAVMIDTLKPLQITEEAAAGSPQRVKLSSSLRTKRGSVLPRSSRRCCSSHRPEPTSSCRSTFPRLHRSQVGDIDAAHARTGPHYWWASTWYYL